jgi:hypothetical protein
MLDGKRWETLSVGRTPAKSRAAHFFVHRVRERIFAALGHACFGFFVKNFLNEK